MPQILCESCTKNRNNSPELTFYKINERIVCQTCLPYESIYVSTSSDIEFDQSFGPISKDIVLVLPVHGLLSLPQYLIEPKKQLLNMAKEEAYTKGANAILHVRYEITKVENLHYLISISADSVYASEIEGFTTVDVQPISFTSPSGSISTQTIGTHPPRSENTFPQEDRIAGKYPDVGGSRHQMDRFRMLSEQANERNQVKKLENK